MLVRVGERGLPLKAVGCRIHIYSVNSLLDERNQMRIIDHELKKVAGVRGRERGDASRQAR